MGQLRVTAATAPHVVVAYSRKKTTRWGDACFVVASPLRLAQQAARVWPQCPGAPYGMQEMRLCGRRVRVEMAEACKAAPTKFWTTFFPGRFQDSVRPLPGDGEHP
jgi:hypothetical protein